MLFKVLKLMQWVIYTLHSKIFLVKGNPLIFTSENITYQPKYMNQDIGVIALKAAMTPEKFR
jgi:hypothetical protein